MIRHLWAVLALSACASSSAPPPAGSPAEHGEHAEHHEKLSGPAHDFHEVLAPLWHAEKGPDRAAKTCEKAMTLHEKATAIAGADGLVAATKALVAECEKEGRPDFEARFAAVHEAFHAVAEGSEHH